MIRYNPQLSKRTKMNYHVKKRRGSSSSMPGELAGGMLNPTHLCGQGRGGPLVHDIPEQHEDFVREATGIQSGVGEVSPVVDILVNGSAELLKGCI